MRENRLSGSEGGAPNDRPYPYSSTPLQGAAPDLADDPRGTQKTRTPG